MLRATPVAFEYDNSIQQDAINRRLFGVTLNLKLTDEVFRSNSCYFGPNVDVERGPHHLSPVFGWFLNVTCLWAAFSKEDSFCLSGQKISCHSDSTSLDFLYVEL
jgi:hypothetical protein